MRWLSVAKRPRRAKCRKHDSKTLRELSSLVMFTAGQITTKRRALNEDGTQASGQHTLTGLPFGIKNRSLAVTYTFVGFSVCPTWSKTKRHVNCNTPPPRPLSLSTSGAKKFPLLSLEFALEGA